MKILQHFYLESWLDLIFIHRDTQASPSVVLVVSETLIFLNIPCLMAEVKATQAVAEAKAPAFPSFYAKHLQKKAKTASTEPTRHARN